MHRPPIMAGDGSRSSSSPVGCWSALALRQRKSTKTKTLSALILIIFAALSALIGCRNFFGLDLRQYSILHDRKKGDATERLPVRRYSKFTPIANEVEGASQSQSQSQSQSLSLSWSLPNTTFTPHISALVEFFKRNRQSFCQPLKGSILVTVKVVDSHNSMPIFMQSNTRDGTHHYQDVFEKLFLRRGSSEQPRILPAGNLTIAMSNSDFDDESDGMCRFANSAPGGHHCVFNTQDMKRWNLNETYPSPLLPWNERESIPVFRGKFWGGGNLKRPEIKFDHNVLESLLHPENDTIVIDGEEMNSKKGGRHKRTNLVYFSKLHPELVNARFSRPSRSTPEMGSQNATMFSRRPRRNPKMWSQNATNGLFQVLPFDVIPAAEYYTKYQTHIVMGGYGAAFRTARILKQGIAVIMQDFPYQEWFTPLMKPFVHYIPLEENLSNLNDTLHWVQDNPSKVFDIAMNGKLFL